MEQPKEERIYTADDFWALPEDFRTELINGVFYDMAPPTRTHQGLLIELSTIINNYIKKKGGDCKVYPAPFGVELHAEMENGDRHVVEPDISVICDPSKLSDRGCEGAPDWIIEISSPGNESHDYIRKLDLYYSAGVREYWIVNPMERKILVYRWTPQTFRVTEHTFADTVAAGIYEDLSIDFSEIEKSL